MKRILPGTKPPQVPGVYRLSDLLPDERRPSIRDSAQRNLYLKGSLISNHTTLAVSNEAQADVDGMPQRLRSVEVQGVSGGTVTVQVKVNGVDAFDDAVRPVSDAGPSDVSSVYVFPAGTEVKSVIEATSGTPTGQANVLIDTEPFVLLGKFQPVVLQGADRLFPSRRRTADILNTVAEPAGLEQASRLFAYSFGGTSPLTAESSSVASGAGGTGTSVRDVPDPRPRPSTSPPPSDWGTGRQ